jgi:hypothetical protein
MKRIALTVPLVSLAISALLPVVPATAGPAISWRGTTNGISSYGFTNDLPAAGAPLAGTTYHGWSVEGSFNIPDGAGHKAYATVFYVEEVYTFDEAGEYVPLSAVFGNTSSLSGGDVTYTADKDLTIAHLVATVPLETCDELGDCTLTGDSRAVDVTWTGTGATTHDTANPRFGSTDLLVRYHVEGDQREATLTGLPGTPNAAGFFSGRTAFHFVYKT